MRRLIGWTAGVVGIAALARMLARRRVHHAPAGPAPPVDDHADALRRKLDESRATEAAQASADEPEPEPEGPQESLEERRARVHAKAQEAIDAMQEPLP
ncbi:MAG TPA: hypothetical protein VFG75_09200 [Gaiella sp.]|nr:hypothetical protein [Gaiella sp.]